MTDSDARRVDGFVVIPAGVTLDAATMRVSVEDVSRADAPAITVGTTIRQVSRISPGDRLPFEVQVPAHLIDPARYYSLRAHIDRSGTDTVKVGDLVSTQSYPVLTRGYGTVHLVVVKQV
jgi:uncharacterized lipoprotein YbaY